MKKFMYNVFACNNSYTFAFVFHQLSVTAQNDEQSHIHFFVTALDKPFFSNRKLSGINRWYHYVWKIYFVKSEMYLKIWTQNRENNISSLWCAVISKHDIVWFSHRSDLKQYWFQLRMFANNSHGYEIDFCQSLSNRAIRSIQTNKNFNLIFKSLARTAVSSTY